MIDFRNGDQEKQEKETGQIEEICGQEAGAQEKGEQEDPAGGARTSKPYRSSPKD
jgi:hypothetical protein